MDKIKFEEISTQLLMFANLAKDLELQEYIKACETSLAIGPILDPTLYRMANAKVEILSRLAQGLRKFQLSIPSFEEAMKADATQALWEHIRG